MGALGRRVGALALALLLALGVAPGTDPGGGPAPAAPAALAPPGFAAVMGYVPVTARLDGSNSPRLVKPAGSCSSPLGQRPFGFEVICKAHDYGYDLLRFAARSGRPPKAKAAVRAARRLVDAQFDHDLHAHCAASRQRLGRLACDGLAAVYAGAVKLNSWWQDSDVP